MTWQRGITHAGAANLGFCERLERVDLMGSPTGDGAIAALRGKPHLRRLSTGRRVTDAGLPLLRNFPAFKRMTDPRPVEAQASRFSPDCRSYERSRSTAVRASRSPARASCRRRSVSATRRSSDVVAW